jgi:hypothetical protein
MTRRALANANSWLLPIVATGLIAVADLAAHPSLADGAVALGRPADVAKGGVATGVSYNYDDTDAARKRAIDECKGSKDAPQSTRDLCKLIRSCGAFWSGEGRSVIVRSAVARPVAGRASRRILQAALHRAHEADLDDPALDPGATFKDHCVAVSLDPKAGTPGFGWSLGIDKGVAEQEAKASCIATAGKSREKFCVISLSRCDGTAAGAASPGTIPNALPSGQERW